MCHTRFSTRASQISVYLFRSEMLKKTVFIWYANDIAFLIEITAHDVELARLNLTKVQRQTAIDHICCTVSESTVLVITGVVLINILVVKRKEIYQRLRNVLILTDWDCMSWLIQGILHTKKTDLDQERRSVQSHVLLEGPSGSTFVRSVASCQQDLRHLWRMFELSFQQDASFWQYFW
ncbi:hypothetical protein J6590_049831 [Homalodisca vitripennis]|nr:hypothetical protein J6590_049831 [Homalodisca vitripennis]